MQINVVDPLYQTALFVTFLSFLLIISLKRDSGPHEMNISHTNELKGVAILMVIFSHIGYFLSANQTFLYPLSVAGGVGVNIFLFLSGYGLATSEIKSTKPVLQFYTKRLKNIFPSMWVVLVSFLLLDLLVLHKSYPLKTVILNFLGFFPNADIDTAINSPLWYFTLILFYYLLFPLVYRKEKYVISALILVVVGYVFSHMKLPVTKDVLKLYQLHYLAFPLGVLFAHFYIKKPGIKIKNYLTKVFSEKWLVTFSFYALNLLLLICFGYMAINSGVGEKVWVEQLISILTVLVLVLVLLLKDVQSKLLIVLGEYSYEIYLIQWPLLYRYDYIYKEFPPFMGTLIYLVLFLALGYMMKKTLKALIKA